MRGFERRGVRQYNRTDAPRMRWTEELHRQFIEAVDCLGGHDEATPKRILQLMGVNGISISHIKSHLQNYAFSQNPGGLAHLAYSHNLRMYRSSSSNSNSSASLQKSTATTGSSNINEPSGVFLDQDVNNASDRNASDHYTTLRCSQSSSYQIPSLEEVFRSWEQISGRGRLPWISNVLATQRAIRPSHTTTGSKKRQNKQTAACRCDLTLSIGFREDAAAAADSIDADGWSTTAEEEAVAPPSMGQNFDAGSPARASDHQFAATASETAAAINLDLTISSSWLS